MATFNTSVGVENKTKPGLNSAMNDIMSWNDKASKKTVLEISAKLNNQSFNKMAAEWESSAKKAMSRLKKFSFEGIYSSPTGKVMREYKKEFKDITKLNQSDALNYLAQLKEIQNLLNKGRLVSNDEFGKKERKQLYELIALLEQATGKYSMMMREERRFNRRFARENDPEVLTRRASSEAKRQNSREMQAARDLERQKKRADELAASTANLTQQENRYNEAKSRNRNTAKGVQEEITELRKLIRLKEQNLRLQQGRRNITDDSQLRGYRDRLRVLEQQNRELGRQGGIFRKLIGYAAGYFSVQQVVQFARKVAETTGYFEQQRVALEGITQNAEKATILFNQIKGLAVKSPFQFKELIGFSKQLSAFQIPVDELFDTTKRLADISAGLGVDMSRIILAFGQVRSASVLRGQELRQFTEAGIPLVDELAKRFTLLEGRMVSTGEVFQRISNRGVSFEMVRDILFDMTEEGGRFYEMQEKISETTYGQIQKLQDYRTIAMSEIGNSTSGMIKWIIQMLQQMVIHWRTSIGVIGGLITTVIIGALNKVTLKAREAGATFFSAFKGFLKLNWVSIALSALAIGIGAIIGKTRDARAEANRLKNELNEIGEQYDKKGVGLVNNFRKLTEALQETTRGSEAERKAYEKLLNMYSEYLPQQDLEIEHLRQLKEGYDEVNKAILAQVEAKKIAAQKEKVMEELNNAINNSINGNNFKTTENLIKNNRSGIYEYFSYFKNASKDREGYTKNEITKFLEANAFESEHFLEEGILNILKKEYVRGSEKYSDEDLDIAFKELVENILSETKKIREENADLLGLGTKNFYDELRNKGYTDEDITNFNLKVRQANLQDLDKQLADRLRNANNEPGSAGKPEVVERNQDAFRFEYALKKADLFGLNYDEENAKSFAADIRAGNKDRDEIIDYLAQIYGIERKKETEEVKTINQGNYDNRYGTLEYFKTNKNRVEAPTIGGAIDKQLEETFFEAIVPILDRIRAIEGFEKTDWTSSYRTPKHNSGTKGASPMSRHLYGEAFDLWLDGNREHAERIVKEVYKELNGQFDQILLEYHPEDKTYGVHVGVATNDRNRKEIKEVDAGKGFSSIEDQTRIKQIQKEAEAELKAEKEAQLEAEKQRTQINEQSTEDLTAYQKAEKNMREEIFKSIERQMIAYRDYEKAVNEYLIDVRDRQTQLDEVKKTTNSLLKMSPTTDYAAYTKRLQDEYDKATGFISKQIEKDPNRIEDPILKKQLETNIQIRDIVEEVADLVNYDLNKKSELPESDKYFGNLLINAFKSYRTVAQETGVENAVRFMLTDADMAKFRGFFTSGASINDINGEEIKVNGKSINDILSTTRINNSEHENDVVNFDAAMTEYIKELNKGSEAQRKWAQQLQSQWQSLISKSKIDRYIQDVKDVFDDLNRSATNLTRTLDMYRQLQNKGIYDNTINNENRISANGELIQQQGSIALLPQSMILMQQLRDAVATYNKLVTDNGGYENTIDIGDINTIEKLTEFIDRLTKQMAVNDGNNDKNFGSQEFGKISKNIVEIATKLRDQQISEIINQSGKQFTGNALADAIANAIIATNSGISTATRGNEYDSGRLQQIAESTMSGAQKIMDEMIGKATREMKDSNGWISKPIDVDKLLSDLDKIINREDTPKALAAALKVIRPKLELKANEVNSQAALIGNSSLGAYFNANKIGKQNYQDLVDAYKQAQKEAEQSMADYLKQKTLVDDFDSNSDKKARAEEGLASKQQQLIEAQSANNIEEINRLNTEISTLSTTIESLAIALGSGNRDVEEAKLGNLLKKATEDAAIATQAQQAVDNTSEGEEIYKQKIAAIESIKARWDDAQNAATNYANVVRSFVSVFQSVSKAAAKFWSILNDGDTPEWMQALDGFLEDFAENFNALIEPISAVIGLVVSLTAAMLMLKSVCPPLLAAMAALIAAAAIVAGVMAAFQAHDRALERQIENIERQIEACEREATALGNLAERTAGFEKWKIQADAIAKSFEQAQMYARIIEKEKAKNHTDLEDLADAEAKYQDAMDEFLNGMKGLVEEVTSDVASMADAMESSLRSAFQNGENAARALRSTVKEMIGDMVSEVMKMQLLEPVIKTLTENWTHAEQMLNDSSYYNVDKNGNKVLNSEKYLSNIIANITNDKAAKEFYNQMLELGDSFIDAINNLPPFLKDAYMSNEQTASLSGGIESTTEDTARRIEALSNSQLAEVIAVRQYMEQMQSTSSAYYSEVSTTVIRINNRVNEISQNTQIIANAIEDMRNNVRPLYVYSA